MPGNDAFTKLLLHCDGTDASTTFTDSSLTAKAWNEFRGLYRRCATGRDHDQLGQPAGLCR